MIRVNVSKFFNTILKKLCVIYMKSWWSIFLENMLNLSNATQNQRYTYFKVKNKRADKYGRYCRSQAKIIPFGAIFSQLNMTNVRVIEYEYVL